jgi:hypothetical protein
MSDGNVLNDDLLNDPARRRLWLIHKGLEHGPLTEALVLARAAEEFLTGGPGEFTPAMTRPELPLVSVDHRDISPAAPSLSEVEQTQKSAPVDRIAGASPDADDLQVGDGVPSAAFDALVSVAGVDDVVRYLRQRDDVVVRTGDGGYLVNGRFRETLEALVERANRIRARHRLPQFVLLPPGGTTAGVR